jgi:hypothetical protein
MRSAILRLKNRQMRGGPTGDAVRQRKSTQRMIGKEPLEMSQSGRFSANCFMPGFGRKSRSKVKAFILLPGALLDCTINVAVRLLVRPGTTLPALPDLRFPVTADAVTDSVPSPF